MARAKVFKSGNSQAVRLPKKFRFDDSEVEIIRRNDEIILRKVPRNLSLLFETLAGLSDDFMKDGRKQPSLQERENL
jgi:antitoxin VapB